MLPPQLLRDAERFVGILKGDPGLLHTPELKFLKEYLEGLGATIPPPKTSRDSPPQHQKTPEKESESSEEPESEESELEFDTSGVIEEESDEPQPMGDDTAEVTEEMIGKAEEKRFEAQTKFSDGDFEGAVALFTESISENPHVAVSFAKRAACYFKLKKPASAIRDCNKAISLNPDSAAAYKWRGLANKALGHWEEAYMDLQTSLKLDYSDDAYEAMKAVEPNYQRIHAHKLKWMRKREEKTFKELKKAHVARQKVYEEAKRHKTEADFQTAEEMPSGLQDAFSKILSDPELVAAMQDPELQTAFTQGMTNPGAFKAAASNPKFADLMKKMGQKIGVSEDAQAAAAPGGSRMKPTGDDGRRWWQDLRLLIRLLACFHWFVSSKSVPFDPFIGGSLVSP
ncbi:mitochondrial import receptor subunit tom34 [Echinococcus multilocularis]|uniref:Mitochondrial import receptor subunit tom34 n=1 Tax=Echinococcus multilocularis TaxID=6211 RepID=A0A068Y8X6_ECHMU|nr:mitochondrial import receptor subunit tom34 [Echinococcus multilocularis]